MHNINEDIKITIENLPFKITLSKADMKFIKPKIEDSFGLDANISKEKLLSAYIKILQDNINLHQYHFL